MGLNLPSWCLICRTREFHIQVDRLRSQFKYSKTHFGISAMVTTSFQTPRFIAFHHSNICLFFDGQLSDYWNLRKCYFFRSLFLLGRCLPIDYSEKQPKCPALLTQLETIRGFTEIPILLCRVSHKTTCWELVVPVYSFSPFFHTPPLQCPYSCLLRRISQHPSRFVTQVLPWWNLGWKTHPDSLLGKCSLYSHYCPPCYNFLFG